MSNLSKKICLWSVAALVLSPLSVILFFFKGANSFSAAILAICTLISSFMPSLARAIRLKMGQIGLGFEIAALIVAALPNSFLCTFMIGIFTTTSNLIFENPLCYLGLLPSIASVITYVLVGKKSK